jgi:hypothetical protein
MRIRVNGTCAAANILRGYLESRPHFNVTTGQADYTVHLVEEPVSSIILDSVDCPLERNIKKFIAQYLPERDLAIRPIGEIQSDREIKVIIPANDKQATDAAALGIFCGLERGVTAKKTPITLEPEPQEERKLTRKESILEWPYWKALWAALVLVLLLLIAVRAHAQESPAGQYPAPIDLKKAGGTTIDSDFYDALNHAFKVNVVAGGAGGGLAQLQVGRASDGAFVNVGYFTGQQSVPTTCVSGCSSTSFADRSAYTFGTTSFGVSGGVFDDTPPADLTTGLSGAFRVTPKRGLHINLRNQAGTEIGTSTTPIRTDPTGTTPQPVSGTVTANQGTANTAANAWPAKVTDGTNTAAVKAASTAAAATDPSAVVALSPNSPIPTGANTIGAISNTGFNVNNSPTVGQGTAAAGTAGWPHTQGNVAAVTAAWTSATTVDTTLSLAVTNYSTIMLSYRGSSTLTAGSLVFEVSDDGGTNWYAFAATRQDVSYTTETSFTIAVTNQLWQSHIVGATNFRVRLNPAISGTGTVNLRLQASAGRLG